jgi:hypothetical protein
MQIVLFFIFVVDFVAFVVVLVASELGYGVSSFEEPTFTRRCRVPQAERAGLNRNTIGRIEEGNTMEVYPRTIRKIAEALNVDPTSIVSEE